MSNPELIRKDHEGGVSEIVLNAAPVNALTADFLNAFADLVHQMETNASVRAILVSSPFKVFSAGLNLKDAQSFDEEAQTAIVDGLNRGFLQLFACPKPTVVAANGAAIAGGFFFILASDLRVAHPQAQLGLAEVRVGVDFPVGPMEIARASLPKTLLRRLMLTGQPMDAATAQAHGVVDILDEDTRERALQEARTLARLPASAYARIKRQIREDTILTIEHAIAHPSDRAQTGWFTEETRAAMRAMIS